MHRNPPEHRIPLEHPSLEAHLLEPEGETLKYVPDPTDGCAAWRLREQATYEVHVAPAGQEAPQASLGSQDLKVRRIGQAWVCTLAPGNYVGPTTLRLRLDGKPLLELPLEVCSKKLDYQTDYRALVDELTERAAALCFSALSPTALRALVEDPDPPTSFLTYLVMRSLMHPDRLPAAVRRIARQPDRRLVREAIWRPFGEARNLTARSLLALMAHPEHLTRARGRGTPAVRRALQGKLPGRLLDEEARLDLDTPPNRFVACALRQVDQTLRTLEQTFREHALEHPARVDQARRLQSDCRAWQQQVAELRRLPFLQGLGSPRGMPSASPALGRREGYREVRDAYYRMRLGGRVRWKALERLLTVPARDLATLYEMWCFFALADALARLSGAPPGWSSLVRAERGVYSVRLRRGRLAALPIGPYWLSYNRSFQRSLQGTWSVPLRPDYVVEMKDGRRWLFDAKYRLKSEDVQEGCEGQPGPGGSFVREDLYKMHTYLDAIRHAQAAFVLYPGSVFRAFARRGRMAERPQDLQAGEGAPTGFQGVGAIPLLPGDTSVLDEALRHILHR